MVNKITTRAELLQLVYQKILLKDYTISYEQAIALQHHMAVNYEWRTILPRGQILLHISLPDYSGLIFNIEEVTK